MRTFSGSTGRLGSRGRPPVLPVPVPMILSTVALSLVVLGVVAGDVAETSSWPALGRGERLTGSAERLALAMALFMSSMDGRTLGPRVVGPGIHKNGKQHIGWFK